MRNYIAGLIIFIGTSFFVFLFLKCTNHTGEQSRWSNNMQVVIDNTKPLKYERGKRLPLYLWPTQDPGELNEKEARMLIKKLDERGIGLTCSWKLQNREKNISNNIRIAKVQKKLGQKINIDATSLLYGFYTDNQSNAHVDDDGNTFFDDSFGEKYKMGCPFTLDLRKDKIRERVEYFLKRYKEENLSVDFIYADWEIDGPIEVNRAYESSKKCTRCRRYLGENFSFDEFQKKMREMRSYLQYYAFSSSVLSYFPDALVGNYAVYPNDGYRYWYDYFEFITDVHPHKTEQKARYRKWFNDFPLTGYTFAMPVVYTWSEIYNWYDFKEKDYRWFFNMLLNASNAGKNTPHNIPIISFVHWNTIFVKGEPDPTIVQFSQEAYQELLWHMLLRGTDTFFMWSSEDEFAVETRLVHEVYAVALKYEKFLDKGIPITFDVPCKPGTVISGLALNDSVLVRRTDFGDNQDPAQILAGTTPITVKYNPGICEVIALDKNEKR